MSRLVEEFIELVKIDSETKHEQVIAPILTSKLEQLGFSVMQDDSAATNGTWSRQSNCYIKRFKSRC